MKQRKTPSPAALCALLAAALCLLDGLLLLFGFALPSQYEDTFLGEMKYKMERLETTEGPRIIVVGGSSVPFALKSGLVEEYLPGYRAVDFGMYAGMGTVVMLDWAQTQAREGDIFVIAPEQNAQTLSCFFSGALAWQAADGAFDLLPAIDSSRYESLAAAFPAFAGKKLWYALTEAPDPEGVYARSSFDEYGDIVYPDRTANIMSGGYNPNDLISFSQDVITEDFIDALNDFARAVTAKGARVVYHFPPMNAAALAPGAGQAAVDAYYDYLDGQLLFPILGDPGRCILDSGWFYDTNFHLNASGAAVFTKLLIEDLKVYLEDTSPTDIALPAMPAPGTSALGTDNTDATLFTYRHTDGGWILSGLTEEGRAAQALTLPGSHQGEPVVGMDETLFSENKNICEIIVQPNIGILYDGMFSGCTALEKLILTGEDPSAYAAGDGLRDGADFLICVPEETLDRYRRDYFWQAYAAWIQPMEG